MSLLHIFAHKILSPQNGPPRLLGLANLSVHAFSTYVVSLTVFQAPVYVLELAMSKTDMGLLTSKLRSWWGQTTNYKTMY